MNAIKNVTSNIFAHTTICVTLAVTLFIVLLSSCSSAPQKPAPLNRDTYTYTRQYGSWFIKKEMKKHDIPGISIALIYDQHLVWAEGFGLADVRKNVRATPNTVYRVASISKLFTSSAVMQLAEQGDINIDRPLSDYLPEFSINTRFSNSDPITPRTIMNHHSGLPTHLYKGLWTDSPILFRDVAGVLKNEYVSFPPNYIFSYSNIGPTILGHMLEKQTGMTFSSYMDKFLFQPLGMTYSSFTPEEKNRSLLAKGYKDSKQLNEPFIRDLPSSSLLSNVLDLGKFIQMVFADGRAGNKQVLQKETMAEMLRTQNYDIPLDFDLEIGLGWFLNTPKISPRNVYHSGGTLTFGSHLVLLPDHKLGVVVLGNSATAVHITQSIAQKILSIALETKTGIRHAEEQKPRPTSFHRLSSPQLDIYTGIYSTDIGIATLRNKHGTFMAEHDDKFFQLIPVDKGRFFIKPLLFGWIPLQPLKDINFLIQDISDRKVLALGINGKRQYFGERIHVSPIPDVWLKRLGAFELLNEDPLFPIQNIILSEKNGLLLLTYTTPIKGENRFYLIPLSNTEAVIPGLGTGKGDTIQIIIADGKEILRYSGYEMRKITTGGLL